MSDRELLREDCLERGGLLGNGRDDVPGNVDDDDDEEADDEEEADRARVGVEGMGGLIADELPPPTGCQAE